jgi:hypothetical protein
MAKVTVFPYPRSKRKTNAPTAETPECGFYESAFLADRGCFACMQQRDEGQEMRVQTSVKGLESGSRKATNHFFNCGHIFTAWVLMVEKPASV